MGEDMIETWFPTPIYYADLNPSDKDSAMMTQYLINFHQDKFSNLAKPGEDFTETARPNLTGDVYGDNQIASQKPFQWLNRQINYHLDKFLEKLGVPSQRFSYHVQKSWPVVIEDGGSVYEHNHSNANFSAVFYIQTEEGNDSGKIAFKSPNEILGNLPLRYNDNNKLNMSVVKYRAIQNRLILFPSALQHEVEIYSGSTPRYSVSYDLNVTVEADERDNEFCVTNPSCWVQL